MVSHQITLRAWSTNADLPPIKINQGDILSRTVFITLVSGGQAVDLTSSTARVHFSKPDGTVVYLTASIVNAAAGIISVTLDSQCTAAPGLVKSIVQVTGPNGENLFFVGLNFQVAVVNIEDSIVSSNEFTALTDALATVQDIDNKADKTTTDNLQNQIDAHTSRTDNPHSVTAAQVGAIPASQKGAAGGVASLDTSGLLAQGMAPTDHTTITLTAASFTTTLHLYKFGRLVLAYCDASFVNFGSFTAAIDIATIPPGWDPPIEVALPTLLPNTVTGATGGKLTLWGGKVTVRPNDFPKVFQGHVVPTVYFL